MKIKSVSVVALVALFAASGCAVEASPDQAAMDEGTTDDGATQAAGEQGAPDESLAQGSPDAPSGAATGTLGASPGNNCREASPGRFVCKNEHRRPAGYAGFTMLDNLDAWRDEKVLVTNTGSVKVRVASQQGLNQIRQETDLEPGASVTLSRIDGIAPFWSVLMFTDAVLGTAEITCEPTNAGLSTAMDAEGSAPGAAHQSNESVNCTGEGGVLDCSNRQMRPAGYGGYVAVDGLSAWKNEKVKLTNTGSVRFTVASVQGANVIRQQTDLAPGASVVLERVDGILPTYGTLIFTDAAPGTVRALAEVIR